MTPLDVLAWLGVIFVGSIVMFFVAGVAVFIKQSIDLIRDK